MTAPDHAALADVIRAAGCNWLGTARVVAAAIFAAVESGEIPPIVPEGVGTVPCETCGERIGWIECPTGGWWSHETHPDDGHDAVPPGIVPEGKVVVDGDPHHVIQLTPDGWIIAHPAQERVDGSLFDCKVRWTGGDVGMYGRFVLEWDDHQDDWALGEHWEPTDG